MEDSSTAAQNHQDGPDSRGLCSARPTHAWDIKSRPLGYSAGHRTPCVTGSRSVIHQRLVSSEVPLQSGRDRPELAPIERRERRLYLTDVVEQELRRQRYSTVREILDSAAQIRTQRRIGHTCYQVFIR